MYSIDYSNLKKNNKFYSLFLIVGVIIFIIGFVILYFLNANRKNYDNEILSHSIRIEETRGSDGDSMYYPVYYYRVGASEYECKAEIKSSYKPDTKNDIVYYDSKDPSKCVTAYSLKKGKIFYLIFILPTIFTLVGAIFLIKNNKKINSIKKLNETGKLVKGIPYSLVDSNVSVNGRPLQKIVVNYHLPTGEMITLNGEPRFDRKVSDEDNLVDLVIDEANPKNYFIDFEINRIGGNRDSDYFKKANDGF